MEKMEKRDVSIKTIIYASFIFVMVITIIAIGYVTYSSWMQSIEDTTEKNINTINNRIIKQIDGFLGDAKCLNKTNQGLIESNVIDLKDEVSREQLFANALKNFQGQGIYSFSYGSEEGEYYGARKNKDQAIEIMRNNKQTQGHSLYYSLTENMLAGELAEDAGEFDPRTRPWYQVAKQVDTVVFSPIYKHFVLDDLALSSSIPVHDKNGNLQGVLGSHINLSSINHYLEQIVTDENAYAFILEKDSGYLIANSLNRKNFETDLDGTFKRLSIEAISQQPIQKIYDEYIKSGEENHIINNNNNQFYLKVTEYYDQGLEWVIMTVLPESPLIISVNNNSKKILLLTILAIFISSLIFLFLTKKYIDPINHLIETQERFANGKLLERALVSRRDEIGLVASSFNVMANTIYSLITTLEDQVEDRTLELNRSNQELLESENQLQLILDSTAEGIYGIDKEGNCTFINASGVKMLGYEDQSELIGKNMHDQIHHSYKDGQAISFENCHLTNALKGKKMAQIDDEVFWKKDGTCFSIEYHSYPQYLEGEIVGAVITFMDNTAEKESIDRIKYLSMHDQLTGLYNRWYIEDAMRRLDTQRNMPLTLMIIDINGLKLVNDAFGHKMGDELIKAVSRIIKSILRSEDIVGRMGGDEFLIILPQTDSTQAEQIKKRIVKVTDAEKLDSVIVSVAIGYAVKDDLAKTLDDIMIAADNKMYKDKLVYGKTMRNETIERVLKNINYKYDEEQIHTERVSQYCQSIAIAMGLCETEIQDIKTAGVLHDIGKIIVPPELLKKSGKLTEEEFSTIKKHPETGYQILKSVDEYLPLAEDVLYHHESWDGSGYPKGLKGEEIPLNARIITVADAYEAMTSKRTYRPARSKEEAIAELKRFAGIQFDPHIVKVFIEEVLN